MTKPPLVVDDFQQPEPVEGSVLIEVSTAGLGGWDITGAYQDPIEFPSVIRGEGVGVAPDGRRVYFGERSLGPFGAFGERTIVPEAEVWDVPDDADDGMAIAMAVAGTGALIPLEHAQIQPGDNVLVTGATGALGQIALQLAPILGAGRVVAAGRHRPSLDRLKERGIADEVVQTGTDDDAAALKAAAGDGFDVVLDVIYGPTVVAALKATAMNARVVSIGIQGGWTAEIPLGLLYYRSLTCVGTGQRPPAEREQIWLRLLRLAVEHDFVVDFAQYTLEETPDAWARQVASPHAKVLATI